MTKNFTAFPRHWLAWRLGEDQRRIKSVLGEWGASYANSPHLDRDCADSVAAARVIRTEPSELQEVQGLIAEAGVQGKGAEILGAEIILSSLGLRQVIEPKTWKMLEEMFPAASPETVPEPFESANSEEENRTNRPGLDLVRPVQVVGSAPVLAAVVQRLSLPVAKLLVIAGGSGQFSSYTKPAVESDLRRRKSETLLDVWDTDSESIILQAPGKTRHKVDVHHLTRHFPNGSFDIVAGEHAIDVGERQDLGLRIRQIDALLRPQGAFVHIHALGLRESQYQEGIFERDAAFLSEMTLHGKTCGLTLLPVLFSKSCVLPRTREFDLHVEKSLNVLECRLGSMKRSFDPALLPNQVRLGVAGIVSILSRNQKLLKELEKEYGRSLFKGKSSLLA